MFSIARSHRRFGKDDELSQKQKPLLIIRERGECSFAISSVGCLKATAVSSYHGVYMGLGSRSNNA